MSATELFEAPSSSWMLNDADVLNDRHELHLLHASSSSVRCSQFMVFAKMRAQVVFPTPRGPQNRKACASWFLRIALFRVLVMESCPITDENVPGLYFRADTTKLSI